MLTHLTIKNFGLIDQTVLEFDQKLNILTGETGAGKSILIDALRCILGERIDSSFLRDPNKPFILEAVFDISDQSLRSNETLTEYLTSDDDNLIIQRTLNPDGKGKIKVNGMTITVSQLKEIGNRLIDFHGPHDHQMLLSESEHLGMLDRLSDFKNVKTEYTAQFNILKKLRNQLHELTALAQTRQRDIDLLSHEVKELESVKLSEHVYEKVLQERIKISNSERLYSHIQQVLDILGNDETGINHVLPKAFAPLKSLSSIDEKTTIWIDQITAIQENTTDLIASISVYAQSLDFDASESEEINRQYDAYTDILRKYGPTLEDANRYYQESRSKLDAINNLADNDNQIREQIQGIEKSLSKLAQQISKSRQAAGQELNKTVEKELKDLGIQHVRFEVRLQKTDFNEYGADHVAFFISPNAGEELKPLAQIVSSGEAARVMLALKKALIKVDPIPVLIFDEIDAQIGGRLGTITGKKLKELASYRQTILITHLPQIASFADKHFKVIKPVVKGRATTEVLVLDDKTRIDEIAQMMSGASTNTISVSHAKDMLAAAQKS